MAQQLRDHTALAENEFCSQIHGGSGNITGEMTETFKIQKTKKFTTSRYNRHNISIIRHLKQDTNNDDTNLYTNTHRKNLKGLIILNNMLTHKGGIPWGPISS